MTRDSRPVLVLGAGINGASVARELALQGLPVVVVDQSDLAYGATAYSTRLVHGGLRYLEFGEFDLVRESLAERSVLLRVAPQFVQRLRLFIPVERRWGGMVVSAARFLGLERWFRRSPRRGLWLVRCGLWLYDWLSPAHAGSAADWPRHEVLRPDDPTAPPVDRHKYRWLAAYYDAQIRYPERFVIALLRDAQRAARSLGIEFHVDTYCTATLADGQVTIRDRAGQIRRNLQPAAIVNATGAWVDLTLATLAVPSPKLMGGTKGSHLFTAHKALRRAVDVGGLYAEADDGRPVFVLPFGPLTMIGTTDLPFSGDPAKAVANEAEIAYLLQTVNDLLPDAALTRADILLHYSGVRPLPRSAPGSPAGITRRHAIHEHADAPLPLYSLVGGKLTTCRSLAAEVVDIILAQLGRTRHTGTESRPLPGACRTWLNRPEQQRPGDTASGTSWSRRWITAVIRHEWVTTLTDLVERRLMLHFDPSLSRQVLSQLANIMVAEGRLTPTDVEPAIAAMIARLREHFGRNL